MAVILLHGSALFTSKVEIPAMDMTVAKKLVPVVAVNIIGLVFNTLCLRDVEASFFQVNWNIVLA
jgi:solute carrier family 35 (GDP-fucose transporter), member C1